MADRHCFTSCSHDLEQFMRAWPSDSSSFRMRGLFNSSLYSRNVSRNWNGRNGRNWLVQTSMYESISAVRPTLIGLLLRGIKRSLRQVMTSFSTGINCSLKWATADFQAAASVRETCTSASSSAGTQCQCWNMKCYWNVLLVLPWKLWKMCLSSSKWCFVGGSSWQARKVTRWMLFIWEET